MSNSDLQEKQQYLTVTPDHYISAEYIKTTRYRNTIIELEEFYGNDDVLNLALTLIHEYFEADAKWKPYVDVLPAVPENFVFDFWNTKKWAEPILQGDYLISK